VKKWICIIIFLTSFIIVFKLADNVTMGIIAGIFWAIVATIAFGAMVLSHDEKEKSQEVKKLFKSAESGNPESQLTLGCIYTNAGERDIAFEWLLKSAEQENSEAQWRLSICFCNGEGTKKDQEKTLFWAKKSADHGNAKGKFWYSLCSACKSIDDINFNLEKLDELFNKVENKNKLATQSNE
jgi:hypothetical protein